MKPREEALLADIEDLVETISDHVERMVKMRRIQELEVDNVLMRVRKLMEKSAVLKYVHLEEQKELAAAEIAEKAARAEAEKAAAEAAAAEEAQKAAEAAQAAMAAPEHEQPAPPAQEAAPEAQAETTDVASVEAQMAAALRASEEALGMAQERTGTEELEAAEHEPVSDVIPPAVPEMPEPPQAMAEAPAPDHLEPIDEAYAEAPEPEAEPVAEPEPAQEMQAAPEPTAAATEAPEAPTVEPTAESASQPEAPAPEPPQPEINLESLQQDYQQLGAEGEGASVNEVWANNGGDLASRLQRQPITNLATAIGLNDKFLFINELFGGSSEAYNRAIDELNNLASMDEARQLMQERGITSANPEALQAFVELVERRYL